MKQKQRFFLAFFLLLIAYIGIDQAFFPQLPQENITIQRHDGSTLDLKLEVAKTNTARERGLMYRFYLPQNHGMIFLFGEPITARFWMKNTFIPLDTLFIDHSGTIIWIEHNMRPLDQTPHGPEQPVVAAIEIKGNTAKGNNIQINDRVIFNQKIN